MTGRAISKAELFARLAEGHAAGVTVVTPNQRLAQVLRNEFDSYQGNRGLTVWEDADILPLASFVARAYEDALYAEGGEKLPLLLSDAQSHELWEEAIRGSKWASALLDVPRTAADARRAWAIANDWGITGALGKAEGNEDVRAFADWAKSYARRLKKEGLVDAATLPALGLRAPKTKLLVGFAFDIVPAQAKEIFGRFDFLSCQPDQKPGNPLKAAFPSPRAELEAAAAWARARLEAGAKRIGVVVPGLEQRRREVVRVFGRVMGSRAAFNLSAGEPLSAYPMVAFALGLVEFSFSEMPFEEVSRLIRSPFLGGAEKEAAARALLDARLRERAPAALTLPKLIGMMDEKWGGRSIFESVYGKAREDESKPRSAHEWARHFTDLLEAAGFPGERALDSEEHQCRAKFNEVLGEFARLALVNSGISKEKAVQQLQRLCSDTQFQPERGEAPVQVLGLLESAGAEFDALWVSGLTDERWPIRASPSPFLPLALQRAAGIPEASADSALALDARITAGWAAASPVTVFSWARREEDRDLLPSPLIANIPEREVEVHAPDSWRERIFKSGRLETYLDEQAPLLKDSTVHGGTRVFADQAACPFRAFARHRLRAEALAEPAPGPDAMERGQLLHAFMASLWKQLGSSSSLLNDVSPQIENAAKAAVAGLGLKGGLAQLEIARLERLGREWLGIERGRAPFEVVAVEKKVELSVGGLALRGRIDRMDRLADGTHAVIDYKTGARVTPKDWEGERPDDPQLPLYTVTAAETVSAAAFAKLRAGDMKFLGFSLKEKQIPGVKAAHDWGAMAAGWKSTLEALAHGFAEGESAVDPKRGLATCRHCDLQTLCRVHERLSALDEAAAAEDDS